MSGNKPDRRRRGLAMPARLVWAARTLTSGVLAAAVAATTAAMPVPAVSHAGHGHQARAAAPGRPAGRAAPAAARASSAALWIHVAAGGGHTCGIRMGNTVWCWGDNQSGQLGTGPTGNQDRPQQITYPTTRWASITAGYSHTCATRTGGTLWCWGANNYGQLGTGTTNGVSWPHQVTIPASTGWASVTAGWSYTCATRSDGTLWCWGANDYGQLGVGIPGGSYLLPQQVTTPAATGWASVTGGGDHTCATRSGGTVWCWGSNSVGQLGDAGPPGDEVQPQQVTVPASTGWASVTAGEAHTCATRTDGTLWCWGYNVFGQLGIGTTTLDKDLPQQVSLPASTGWASVTGGGVYTCATRTRALWCWGDGREGQLGSGIPHSTSSPRQVQRPARAGWTLVTAGFPHSCATRTDGTLWCWGDNQYGQLGIGNTSGQDLPQQVTP
jgi:alpha-tubulin suppressor-like RCC1 family protein